MEQLTIVEYKEHKIRVYGLKHNPWFSGEDVAKVLGYSMFADALRKVDAEDKSNMMINEYGLFTLISLGAYKEFKRFVTQEMLPQIHKKGQCKQANFSEKKKKHERLYEIASGERLNRTNLSYRAVIHGMTKTEAKRSRVASLVYFINEKETRIAEKEMLEKRKADYPYTYDDIDEMSYGNISVLWRVMPTNSYVQYNGKYFFSEQAVQAIKTEMSKWK